MSREELAEKLVEARRGGERIATLPPALVPASEENAYAVQEAVIRRLGATVAGWKVGAASAASAPSAAPLFANLVATSPARLPAGSSSLRGVEAELALRLGRDLPARAAPYGEEEAWAAVDTLHVAIELLDSRYLDRKAAGELAALADNLSNGGFCHALAIRDWRGVDFLRQPAELLVDGESAARAVGGNPAGHPRRLLAWLANHCAQRGRPLAAGQIVTTGSHTGLVIAPPGARVTARFAGLGEASLSLASV
jgi:2-keto-4-pentenoate hydratase